MSTYSSRYHGETKLPAPTTTGPVIEAVVKGTNNGAPITTVRRYTLECDPQYALVDEGNGTTQVYYYDSRNARATVLVRTESIQVLS